MTRPTVPLVIAHRGASGTLPENTLPAYELAARQRADMIEIDLHRTRDGEMVVTHDEDLAGLGGRGEIADATLAEIRSLDAGNGERVPILGTGPGLQPGSIGVRTTYADMGETIAEHMELTPGKHGTSFLADLAANA